MVNYQNGRIYTLRSHQTDDIYIGSTTRMLRKRMAEHRYNYKHRKTHTSAHQILQYEDCYIELLEEFPCDNKEQLEKREMECVRNMDCVNKLKWRRTRTEYMREYREKKKDALIEC